MLRKLTRRIAKACRKATLPPIVRSIKAERLTYLSFAKLARLQKCLRRIEVAQVPGALLEFGVALGGSAVLIAQHAHPGRRAFHGFDVFGMIPPPASDKDDARSRERYEVIAAGRSPGICGDTYYGYRTDLYGQVLATFARYGRPVDGETVALHRGLFETTWSAFRHPRVAFAHIDCDWYDPVRFCLEAVAPLLASGAIVVLDDYNDYGGCRTATDEFLASRPGAFEVRAGANLVLVRR